MLSYKEKSKAKYTFSKPVSQRLSRERLVLYGAILVAFSCIAISNATVAWIKIDWLVNDVRGDEYKGLWNVCFDRPNRALETSCHELAGTVGIFQVRWLMCVSFLLFAVIFGYMIATHFRSDLTITPIGIILVFSGLCACCALITYTKINPVPRGHWLFRRAYGWSYGVGWFGMLLTMFIGFVCISIPKVE